jgi:hypothetical protein
MAKNPPIKSPIPKGYRRLVGRDLHLANVVTIIHDRVKAGDFSDILMSQLADAVCLKVPDLQFVMKRGEGLGLWGCPGESWCKVTSFSIRGQRFEFGQAQGVMDLGEDEEDDDDEIEAGFEDTTRPIVNDPRKSFRDRAISPDEKTFYDLKISELKQEGGDGTLCYTADVFAKDVGSKREADHIVRGKEFSNVEALLEWWREAFKDGHDSMARIREEQRLDAVLAWLAELPAPQLAEEAEGTPVAYLDPDTYELVAQAHQREQDAPMFEVAEGLLYPLVGVVAYGPAPDGLRWPALDVQEEVPAPFDIKQWAWERAGEEELAIVELEPMTYALVAKALDIEIAEGAAEFSYRFEYPDGSEDELVDAKSKVVTFVPAEDGLSLADEPGFEGFATNAPPRTVLDWALSLERNGNEVRIHPDAYAKLIEEQHPDTAEFNQVYGLEYVTIDELMFFRDPEGHAYEAAVDVTPVQVETAPTNGNGKHEVPDDFEDPHFEFTLSDGTAVTVHMRNTGGGWWRVLTKGDVADAGEHVQSVKAKDLGEDKELWAKANSENLRKRYAGAVNAR